MLTQLADYAKRLILSANVNSEAFLTPNGVYEQLLSFLTGQ